MQKGKAYKAIAIILFALIFIGAVAVGNFELFRALAEGDFNFGVFLYIAGAGLVACIPIYGIGDAIDERCEGDCRKKGFEKNEAVAVTSKSDGWICKKCSIKNESIATFCKNCGEYK